jgi:hypothetical protein
MAASGNTADGNNGSLVRRREQSHQSAAPGPSCRHRVLWGWACRKARRAQGELFAAPIA